MSFSISNVCAAVKILRLYEKVFAFETVHDTSALPEKRVDFGVIGTTIPGTVAYSVKVLFASIRVILGNEENAIEGAVGRRMPYHGAHGRIRQKNTDLFV
jgi:hypothetical protein